MPRSLQVVAALLMCACSTSGAGPCIVRYEDPLLTIAQVVDTRSSALLPQVYVRNVRFNGTAVGDFRLLTEGGPIRGVLVTGSDLECTVACGFGTQEGTYEMTIYRPSFRDTTFSVDARYRGRSSGSGGCPTVFSDGVVLNLRLTPL